MLLIVWEIFFFENDSLGDLVERNNIVFGWGLKTAQDFDGICDEACRVVSFLLVLAS